MRPMRTLTRRLGRSGSVSASRHRQCTQQAQHADGVGVTDGVGTVEGVGVTGGVSVGGFHYMKPSGGVSSACRIPVSCNSP